MKNLLTLFVLFLGFGMANAQTEAETLEWLNTKKADIFSISSLTLNSGYDNEKLDISSEQLHAYSDKGAYTKISWNSIKDIKIKYDKYITIVSNTMYNGKNSFISFEVNEAILPKYLKALKHMATLKGAKLVNDDLF